MLVFIVSYAGILALWRYICYIEGDYQLRLNEVEATYQKKLRAAEEVFLERIRCLERRMFEVEARSKGK